MARIVLIDDDPFVREDLHNALTGAGHDVVVHSGGNAAIKAIVADPPHLIITDIVMEDGEGMDLITKTRERCPDVGVIAISSNQKYLQYAAALGALLTMRKPFNPQELLGKIAPLIEPVESA